MNRLSHAMPIFGPVILEVKAVILINLPCQWVVMGIDIIRGHITRSIRFLNALMLLCSVWQIDVLLGYNHGKKL